MSVFDARLQRIEGLVQDLRLDMEAAEKRCLPPYIPVVLPGCVVSFGKRDPEYRLIVQTQVLPDVYGAVDLESNLIIGTASTVAGLMDSGNYTFIYASLEEYFAAL
jgi:hypothetical protein